MTPSPTPTPKFEIYANEECTVRPSAGVEYQTLYLKCNIEFTSVSEPYYYDELGGNAFGKLDVYYNDEIPGDPPYFIYLYEDWAHEFASPINPGDVITLSNFAPDIAVIPDDCIFDFY